jgi:hypothetical protein
MKFQIAALGIISFSLIACGTETAGKKPEIVNISLSNSNNSNVTAVDPSASAGNAISANGNHAISTGPPPNAKPLTYAAPDNSIYGVEMGSSGLPVETRIFTSDRYIAKVVRSWQDPSKKTISIFLRSGKVVAIAGDTWPDIKSQPVSAFYKAAGINLAKDPPAETKRKTEQPQ